MMNKTQPQNVYPNLNETVMELMRTLQNMKNKKEQIEKDIEIGETQRMELAQKINQCIEEHDNIVNILDQKYATLETYDKILNESDSAYSKIVKSTEALYQMVKSEEKKIGGNYNINTNNKSKNI